MGIGSMARRATAVAVASVLAATMTTTAAQADATPPAPAPVVITGDSVVFTLTTAAGTEEVVSLEKFAAEVARTPRLIRGGVSTNAVSRVEGNWYKTSNIYFNKDETNRIAAGAAVVYMLPAGVPNVVVQAIRAAALGVGAWAGIAIASGMCVGIKTPITIGPRVPLPIYHRSGFCY